MFIKNMSLINQRYSYSLSSSPIDGVPLTSFVTERCRFVPIGKKIRGGQTRKQVVSVVVADVRTGRHGVVQQKRRLSRQRGDPHSRGCTAVALPGKETHRQIARQTREHESSL